MSDNTKIEWTDSTVNFWWGCTKIGPDRWRFRSRTFAGLANAMADQWGGTVEDALFAGAPA